MLTIKVKKHSSTHTNTIPAEDVAFEQLFTDADGDLFYRCFEGAIMFDTGGDELHSYSEEDLTDYEKHGFLKHCVVVEGTVKVKIKVGK